MGGADTWDDVVDIDIDIVTFAKVHTFCSRSSIINSNHGLLR